jgi:beta-lactamase regulating signal transducer with metallopeptidase domain
MEERERACDEDVLRLGKEPQAYADGILNVCKSYLGWPAQCVSGVTGSDL